MKKTMIWIITVALFLGLAVGCSNTTSNESVTNNANQEGNSAIRTITDLMGRTVDIPVTVKRIVALGNTPRMITYLGLVDKTVGISGMNPDAITPVTAYAYANKELWANIPLVGTDAAGANNYYPEKIIEVEPDIIVCSYPPELADEIQSKTGIPVVSVFTGTLFGTDYEDSLRMLADVCGVQNRAQEVIDFIHNCLDDLHERTSNVPDDDKPSVLGAAATFRGSHGIDGVYSNYRILEVLNANDVTKGFSGVVGGILVDKEQILDWDPEYIFFDFTGFAIVQQDFKNNPRFYNQLRAVQKGNLYQYPNATSYYSNVEIPIVNAYYIASIIFPDQFKDIDFRDKASEIFKFFLNDADYLHKLEAFGAKYGKVTPGVDE